MAEINNGLVYKGHPLMRKDNMVYYGSMADKYIVILQVLESKKFEDLDLDIAWYDTGLGTKISSVHAPHIL